MSFRCAIILFVVVACAGVSSILGAQQLTATRFEVSGPAWDGLNGAAIGTRDVIPLVIANNSPTAQPIRFLTGNNGSERAMEISSNADVWMRGSLSIGKTTGAALNEIARIGTLPATNGRGLTIDMTATSTSTGLLVSSVGTTGEDNAGITLQSSSNGIGTAMRIGGPSGSVRPTFGTGIDITGGTGIRYNALSNGSGTAIEIGGSASPVIGVDAIVSGTGHIGVLARANTNGVGVIGLSYSGSYTAIPTNDGIGVIGRAASNSNIAMDSVIGILAQAERGGQGGTRTTTIGLLSEAISKGTQHSGTAIGVVGSAQSWSQGTSVAIGGAFMAAPLDLSLVTLGGSVLLGCAVAYQPNAFTNSTLTGDTRTQTQVYSIEVSGVPSLVNHITVNLTSVTVNDLQPADSPIVRVIPNAGGTDIVGIGGIKEGRLVTIINTGGELNIVPENGLAGAQFRIMTPNMAAMIMPPQGVVTLWYDPVNERWRVISSNF
jgi:urease beta subunit